MDKNTRVYLQDILESIEKIQTYTSGLSQEEFDENAEKQDSVIRRFAIIGEAVKQLPDAIKEKHSSIPWKDIAGMRDILIHEYAGVNISRLWKTIQEDLLPLKKQIEQILNSKNPGQSGFSTVEMLIAFVVVILSITAVVGVVFGSQSIGIDTLTNQEAQIIATNKLEDARALSRQNFDQLNDTATTTINSGSLAYQQRTRVSDISPCTKQVKSQVLWQNEIRPQSVKISTTVSNPEEATRLGSDCSSAALGDGWTHPGTLVSRELKKDTSLGDNPSVNSDAGTQATDIDVLGNMIYMTGGVTSATPKDDFFVLDNTNILNKIKPPIVGSRHTGPGLNALDIVHYNLSGKTYAYVVQNDNQNQFLVIDVTTPSSPQVVATSTIPNLTFTCTPLSSPCKAGRSIFYYQDRVYIGTGYLAFGGVGENHELHIYDVTIPTSPVWQKSINVNRNVNEIVVRDGLAYLSTGPGSSTPYTPLKIYDVDPTSPTYLSQVASFAAPGNEQGTSLYLLGNKLYFGLERAPSSRKDFYILKADALPSITEFGATNLTLNSNTEVTGILVSGKYAFLTITDPNFGFGVLDISTPSSIGSVSKYNYSQDATGIDTDQYGFMYTSNQKNDALRIIRPAECADKIDDESTPDGKIDATDPQCHTDGNASNPASYNPEDDNETS